MKKFFILILSILITNNLIAMPIWFDNGDVIDIDYDNSRTIDEIYIKSMDFGGDAFISLKIDNKIYEKKEVGKKADFIVWKTEIPENSKLQFEFSGEKLLVFDFGILYKDATELEKNIKKYQFSLKHYNNENNIFSLKEEVGKNFLMIQIFQLHCITCKEKLPFVNEYSKTYKKTKIISMNAGERPEDIDFYFNKNNIGLECIVDSDYEICRQLEVYGVPHTIFFGLDGEILERGNLSTEEISIMLDKLEDL